MNTSEQLYSKLLTYDSTDVLFLVRNDRALCTRYLSLRTEHVLRSMGPRNKYMSPCYVSLLTCQVRATAYAQLREGIRTEVR